MNTAPPPHEDFEPELFLRPYLDELPITGAAISLFVGTGSETRVAATDDVAIALDEVQFSVGEGPRWDAARTRSPVVVPDTRTAHETWPALGTALADTGAAAVFALPLMVGAVDIGVIELHHSVAGPLTGPAIAHAGQLAWKTSWQLLHMVIDENRAGGDGGHPPPEPLGRREIHQATGMILVQANVPAADALLLLRARAFAEDLTLQDAARAVINRELTFSSGAGSSGPGHPGPGAGPDEKKVSDQPDGEEH